MLGKDLYKIEVNAELSNERLRSLVFFYGPLIGDKALVLYEYLVLRGNRPVFEEINELLMSVNLSIDDFEFFCIKLNEYRLLKTLKQENRYIFALNNPLEIRQFIKDDIMVRNFILNTSGEYFRQLTGDKEGESYLKKKPERNYDFDTMFDVNVFLKDISLTLLPMRFRTKENMKQLALMADLYNISYDKMRTYLPKVARTDSNEFDLKELRYLCMNAKSEYKKVENDSYDVPCIRFLMSLQGGKEATNYDKKIIYRLFEDYHLSAPVINVLLEHGLKNCNNSLIENYLYPIASDLHRNDVKTSKEALERLSKPYEKKGRNVEKPPVYDDSANKTMSAMEEEELLKLMGKK